MDENIEDNIRPEYGPEVFAKGVRGKYYERYQAGTNLVLLAPDIRAAFPSDDAVNEALRMLIRLARQSVPDDGVETQSPVSSRAV